MLGVAKPPKGMAIEAVEEDAVEDEDGDGDEENAVDKARAGVGALPTEDRAGAKA
jgi:hypothetical protein